MSQDPLQLVPMQKWSELQTVMLSDSPRSLPGFNVLETQLKWDKEGHNYYKLQVYCLYGDFKNGFIAIRDKKLNYEMVIQYPKDDLKILEEALNTTKVIDWSRKMTLPFMISEFLPVVERVINRTNLIMCLGIPSYTFMVVKGSSLFEDVSLPLGFDFRLLPFDCIDLVDSKWPHRYPNSTLYFELLIKAKMGYGLYKDGELTSWIFISEWGYLTHLYTMENHRKKGYAELVLKLISNKILKEGEADVIAYCVNGNDNAFKLYHKIGFKQTLDISWCFLE